MNCHVMPNQKPGILLIDKPSGWTSSDVVIKLRNRFKLKKIGHGGTLDPAATGLLVVLIGREATRLADKVMAGLKRYRATLQLGVTSDTLDLDGRIQEFRSYRSVTPESFEQTLTHFRGEILQCPPMVSALQINGKRLYKLAREGVTVERKLRPVTIHELTLSELYLPRADLEVLCTKGTYIRTLCDDIGRELGCGAVLADLRRTQSGRWSIDDATPLHEALTWSPEALAAHTIEVPA